LNKVLKIFSKHLLYYVMFVLENKEGESPLKVAIKNDSTRIIELILTYLIKLKHFSLSRLISGEFSNLLRLNLKSFQIYINSCYFQTEQMKSISMCDLSDRKKVLREHHSCSVLDESFYKAYKIPDKKGNIIFRDEILPNTSSVSPEEPTSPNQIDGNKALEILEEDKKALQRVVIKGIEFDWLFTDDRIHTLMKDLSESTNSQLFKLDIIKDIVLFQWKYFKSAIIWQIFLPYLIYLLIFCVYSTWLQKQKHEEDEALGKFQIGSYITGVVILMFNVFWTYTEIRQIILYGFQYFLSFWNILDMLAILLNVMVVLMDFTNVSFNNVNRVGALAVLLLYLKLFYFMRIFFATANNIRMIIETIKTMKFFISVLFIATVAFGNAFFVLGRNSDRVDSELNAENLLDAIIFSYKVGIGGFITEGFGDQGDEILWIFYFLNSMIIVIVLLNLVVAIMGATFTRSQEYQDQSMLQDLTFLIRENEFMFSRFDEFKRAKYVIVIEPQIVDNQSEENWDGQFNELKKLIQKASDKHIEHINSLDENIDELSKSTLN